MNAIKVKRVCRAQNLYEAFISTVDYAAKIESKKDGLIHLQYCEMILEFAGVI